MIPGWVSWASYGSALLPLGGALAMRRKLPAEYWLVGLAWWLAVGSDTQALLSGGTWTNTYVWPALSFTVMALAFVRNVAVMSAIVVVLAGTAWLSMHGGMGAPDMWVTFVGSIAVLFYADGPLRGAMLWYCAVATSCYVGYAISVTNYEVAASFWIAYKLATLVAFGLFGRALWRTATA